MIHLRHSSTRPREASSGRRGDLCLQALCGALLAGVCATTAVADPEPEVGPRVFAIHAAKALVCELDGVQTIDHATLLVQGERILAIGPTAEVELPEDCVELDVGDRWVMPGIIDLHTHAGGSRGYNDTIYQLNPGLRVSTTVEPYNRKLQVALATGITTILHIPGSGSNIGGQGILMKTGPGRYEDILVRDPGSMKLAQGDNPKRWGYGMNRALMNYHIRVGLRAGMAYAKLWEAYERGEGPEPQRRLNLDIFRQLYTKATQISIHTQYFQVVLASLTILRAEFGYDVYIDHGSFDSWKLGGLAEELQVPAILGPRHVLWPSPPRNDTDGRAVGSAAGFQSLGHTRIGFNTDAPVIPLHGLPTQAAMGVRYGMDDSRMASVRGLTIIPAVVAGLGRDLGSLEPGKLADVLVVTGDPSDPRTTVEKVLIAGQTVYDIETEARRW